MDLDDEDSLTDRFQRPAQRGLVDIAVIRLPRISNFTDFNPLACLEQVSLRYVDSVASLGQPHVIILPGTKNTMEDLKWLRESGLEAAICRHASRGGAVMGICGGYQMLGSRLSDPEGVEAGGQMRGMGLLEAETVFQGEKTRTRVRGRVLQAQGIFEPLAGTAFAGYEIHMGRTTSPLQAFAELEGGKSSRDGLCAGNVFGTYVHGIFDEGAFSRAFVNCILRSLGLTETTGAVDWRTYKERQYDALAQGVREALDMPYIYRLLGLPAGENRK